MIVASLIVILFFVVIVFLIAFMNLKVNLDFQEREHDRTAVDLYNRIDKLREEFKNYMTTQTDVLTGVESGVAAVQAELVAHTAAIASIEQALAAEIALAATNGTPLDPTRIASIQASLVAVVGALQAQDAAIATAVATTAPASVVTPAPVETPAPAAS